MEGMCLQAQDTRGCRQPADEEGEAGTSALGRTEDPALLGPWLWTSGLQAARE